MRRRPVRQAGYHNVFRLELRYVHSSDFLPLVDIEGDVIEFRNDEKSAADRVLWALGGPKLVEARFVEHGKAKT